LFWRDFNYKVPPLFTKLFKQEIIFLNLKRVNMSKTGFIGTGIMGKPMARNLIGAGYGLKKSPPQALCILHTKDLKDILSL